MTRCADLLALIPVTLLLVGLIGLGGKALSEADEQAACQLNLRRIGRAMEAYAVEYDGWYPSNRDVADEPEGRELQTDTATSLALLIRRGAFRDASPFVCPASGRSPETVTEASRFRFTGVPDYSYRKLLQRLGDEERARVPILADRTWGRTGEGGHTGGFNALFAGGRVEAFVMGDEWFTHLVYNPDDLLIHDFIPPIRELGSD